MQSINSTRFTGWSVKALDLCRIEAQVHLFALFKSLFQGSVRFKLSKPTSMPT